MILNRTMHLVIFARQFASMMNSGLQLVTVLDDLARETPKRELREAVKDISRRVRAGVDVADAFACHPKLFDSIFIGIVSAGLESGRLGEALLQIVEYLERTDQVRRRITTAMTYPVFLLFTFLVAAGGMIFFILPKYQLLFGSFGHDLPGPTQFLLDIGSFLRAEWMSLAAIGGGGVFIAVLVISTPAGRRSWDRVKLRVPLLGQVWRLASLGRFSRTLSIQVRNHIPVVLALRFAANSAGNQYVRQLVLAISNDIEQGQSVTQAFKSRDIFSGIVMQMIAAGEEAGTLDELLISAAAYFDSLLLQRIDSLTGMLNPVLTAFMGLSISGMMVAAFLPVFDLPGVMG
jgi:type II secretory pathway component PulF